MQVRSNVSIEEGARNLATLRKDIGDSFDWNEAGARFHIIDRILTECLGWAKQPDCFHVEMNVDGEFADYVLGSPKVVVWEAKRTGIYFDFPADITKKTTQSLRGVFAASKSAEAAIRQAQGYCNDAGVEFAVVCNGHQIIAFTAVKVGQSWIDGNALIIRDLANFQEVFPTVWQCLSPDGVAERRLSAMLTTGMPRSIPRKLSTLLLSFPQFRYPSALQTDLRTISELLIEDIISTEALREQFYKECYCDTGALSRDALVSEEILKARYSALFSTEEEAPRLEAAVGDGDKVSLSDQIMTEALARRPIVLLGDVGVGKTSFLHELMYVRASSEFARAITVYIDLGSKAALHNDIRSFVMSDIEKQLSDKYNVDIHQYEFVRGVYDFEIKKFRGSFKGHTYKSNKLKYDEEMNAKIDEHLADRPEHLRRSIEHIAKARKRQVIIIFDNADQRLASVQQEAFIIAQEFAQHWNALVFIAVRPQTFFQSKRAGALSAYPHKVFTILPPRPELVIEKRLEFALKIAEGKVKLDKLYAVKLNLSSMTIFLKALLLSLHNNKDLREILANITAGDIRKIIEFITKFIGSPNVEAEKIVDLQSRSGCYIIPIHEFSKAAILGDYSRYVPETSMAMNVFDVQNNDSKEHFLCLMILAFLNSSGPEKDVDGFISATDIMDEMQNWNFLPAQTELALRRLNNKKLIETTERITFEEDRLGILDDLPTGFRITSVGAYHLHRWATSFSYLDAMVYDTPIFDPSVMDAIAPLKESFDIAHRLERTILFRSYLTAVWEASHLRPSYFDWSEDIKYGQPSFNSVQVAVERNGLKAKLGRF